MTDHYIERDAMFKAQLAEDPGNEELKRRIAINKALRRQAVNESWDRLLDDVWGPDE